jgi:isoleucyl-tRNA synthetase
VPIPALYSVSTGTPHLTPSSVDHILSVLSTNGGLKAWWDLPAEAFVSPDLADSAEGKDGWRKGTDTMDVWFDSGSAWSLITPRESGSTVEKPLADVVLEGSDQHRGWFQSLLLTYLSASSQDATTKPRAPYKTVVTHGMVLDDEKRKMSKSEGNILAPEGVMDGSAFKDGGPEDQGVGKKKKGVQKVRCLSSQPRPFAARALLTVPDASSSPSLRRTTVPTPFGSGQPRTTTRATHTSVGKPSTRPLTTCSSSAESCVSSPAQSGRARRPSLNLSARNSPWCVVHYLIILCSNRPRCSATECRLLLCFQADRYVLHLLAEYEESVSQQYESFAFHTAC